MRVVYFAHDLGDPAIARRADMLTISGALMRLVGFRRRPGPVSGLSAYEVADLGRTGDGRLAARALTILRYAVDRRKWRQAMADADVVMARTLEMLALAAVARALYAPRARLVYECLDIHSLMVSSGWPGRILRFVERFLLKRTELLLVSSPAFVSAYFEPRQGVNRDLSVPVLLFENKVFAEVRPQVSVFDRLKAANRRPGPPWRIGWYGMIRCQKSFDILSGLAERRPDLLQVVIAGRPSRTKRVDLAHQVAEHPAITFKGAYDLKDLPALYADVHFNWAIDYYESDGNSAWLLPNRIYEGGQAGAIPIAQRGVEIGRWLVRRGMGVLLDDPATELESFLEQMTDEHYRAFARGVSRAPLRNFIADRRDSAQLVRWMSEVAA